MSEDDQSMNPSGPPEDDRSQDQPADPDGSPESEPEEGAAGVQSAIDDLDIDRRTLLLGIPALGVAAAGCYAGIQAVSNGGGPTGGSDADDTETPFGYGGTRTGNGGAVGGQDGTATAGTTGTSRPAQDGTGTATATETVTETPGDYGTQGYGEYGYGGVFL